MYENCYIRCLETELIRLNKENEELRQIKEVYNFDGFKEFEIENEYEAANEWVLKKKCSLLYKKYDEPFRGGVILKVGKYSSHLYIDDSLYALHEPDRLAGEFSYLMMREIFTQRIKDLKKNIDLGLNKKGNRK